MSKEEPYVILVGIDFSSLSDLALARACDLAGAHPQCHLHVVYGEARTTRYAAATTPRTPNRATKAI